MNSNAKNLAIISLIINAVLVIAVIILFVNVSKKGGHEAVIPSGTDSTLDVTKMHEKGQPGVMVFYHADSVTLNANLMIDLQNELMGKQMAAEEKMTKKQNEMRRWEEKWQAKQPLMSHEQEQYMREGQQLQAEAMEMQQLLEQELFQEQNRLTLTGITRVTNYCSQLASANGYDYVTSYSPGGQFMFCNPKMDITAELIKMMNDDYGPALSDSSAAAPVTVPAQ